MAIKDPPVTISMPSNAIVNGSGLLDTVSGAHDAPSPVIFDKYAIDLKA